MLKQRGCQHTEIGKEACYDCMYMGIHPKITNVPLKNKKGEISNFSSPFASMRLIIEPNASSEAMSCWISVSKQQNKVSL